MCAATASTVIHNPSLRVSPDKVISTMPVPAHTQTFSDRYRNIFMVRTFVVAVRVLGLPTTRQLPLLQPFVVLLK